MYVNLGGENCHGGHAWYSYKGNGNVLVGVENTGCQKNCTINITTDYSEVWTCNID